MPPKSSDKFLTAPFSQSTKAIWSGGTPNGTYSLPYYPPACELRIECPVNLDCVPRLHSAPECAMEETRRRGVKAPALSDGGPCCPEIRRMAVHYRAHGPAQN